MWTRDRLEEARQRCPHSYYVNTYSDMNVDEKNSKSHVCLTAVRVYLGSMKAELKGLAHAKIIKKSVILFRVLNMTI